MPKLNWPPRTKGDLIASHLRKRLREYGYNIRNIFDSSVTVQVPGFPNRVIDIEFIGKGRITIRLATIQTLVSAKNPQETTQRISFTNLYLRSNGNPPIYVMDQLSNRKAILAYSNRKIEDIVKEVEYRLYTCGIAWLTHDLGTEQTCDTCPHQLRCLGNEL